MQINWNAEIDVQATRDRLQPCHHDNFHSGIASAMAWDSLKAGQSDTVIVLVEDEATVWKTLESALDHVDVNGLMDVPLDTSTVWTL